MWYILVDIADRCLATMTEVKDALIIDPDHVRDDALAILKSVADNTDGFTERESQIEMTATLAVALASAKVREDTQHGKTKDHTTTGVSSGPSAAGDDAAAAALGPVVLCEAGPGTGKSIAYLSAAVAAARATGARIVISTGTVALQEQLVYRDIPMFAQKSGLKVRAAVAKGRGRYACPVKLQQVPPEGQTSVQQSFAGIEAPGDLSTSRAVAAMNAAFLLGEWNGDFDDWGDELQPKARAAATMRAASCMKNHCPKRSQCPFYAARGDLDKADIVVANHHMTLADLRIKNGGHLTGCAPNQTIYVFDEGHHLPTTAKALLQRRLSLAHVSTTLASVPARVGNLSGLLGSAARTTLDHDDLAAACEDAKMIADGLSSRLDAAHFQSSQPTSYAAPDTHRFKRGRLPPALAASLAELSGHMEAIGNHVTRVGRAVDRACDHLTDQDASRVREFLGELRADISEISDSLYILTWADKKDTVPFARWLIRDDHGGRPNIAVMVGPTRVGGGLRHMLWRRAAGAAITSATLSSLGTFDKIKRDTGLNLYPPVSEARMDTPFDYHNAGVIRVPAMAHTPQGIDCGDFYKEVASKLPALVAAEPGGVLVLFTAKRWMEDTLTRLPDALRNQVLAQGTRSKSAVLDEHRRRVQLGQQSILFGLASFAEGLDLPGDLCRHVIITRLSFQPPNDPVTQTIIEHMESVGASPFDLMMLPEASIKLIQSVGRLLRTESDTGCVSILDKRIVTKSYGPKLQADLPSFRWEIPDSYRPATRHHRDGALRQHPSTAPTRFAF